MSPGEDIISTLISAEEQPDRISDDELISICLMTLLGGHRNLRNIIGVAVLTLLCNPDQLKKLQAEPSLLPIAVEELLRYDFIEQGRTVALLWLMLRSAARSFIQGNVSFSTGSLTKIQRSLRSQINLMLAGARTATLHLALAATLARAKRRLVESYWRSRLLPCCGAYPICPLQ